jgi:hypothetical protein
VPYPTRNSYSVSNSVLSIAVGVLRVSESMREDFSAMAIRLSYLGIVCHGGCLYEFKEREFVLALFYKT